MTQDQLAQFANDRTSTVTFTLDLIVMNGRMTPEQRLAFTNTVVRIARGLVVQTGMLLGDDVEVQMHRHSSSLGRREIDIHTAPED